MTYAGQVARRASRFPTYTITRVAAVVAALVAAGILAIVAIQVLGLQRPTFTPPSVNPLVLLAEARWELQHQLVSGDLDPQQEAEREWESRSHQISYLRY
jgi:hypothetical protein